MTVLHINAVYKIGSTGRFVHELCEQADKKGIKSFVATTKGPNKENVYKIGNKLDWKAHGFLSRVFGKQGYFSYFSTKRFLNEVDKIRPDIIHLHNLHANYINLPMLMKYIAKKEIPLVVTLHDCWFFTGKCCHYTADNCLKWQTECQKCPSIKKYNKSWFFDRTHFLHSEKIKLFTSINNLYVVGVSKWISRQAEKAPVFNNAKEINCIYNWVDTTVFAPKDYTELKNKYNPDNKKIILCVASIWSAEKGFDKIVELSQLIGNDEQIVVLGRISEKNKKRLPNNVVCVPNIYSTEELAQFYSMADVLFQPSLEETFGLVVAEAMSCGTPVVCFNSTASPELVNNVRGGVVSDYSIQSALCEIRRVLENGKAYYSGNCREYSTRMFEKKKNTNKYCKLYEDILKNNT